MPVIFPRFYYNLIESRMSRRSRNLFLLSFLHAVVPLYQYRDASPSPSVWALRLPAVRHFHCAPKTIS